MKNCTLCGKEHPDDYDYCPDDGTRLRAPQPAGQGFLSSRDISKAEKAFWQRMTFRQFGLLIVRIQSLWLLFDAAYSLTYFVAYLQRGARIASVSGISSTFGLDIFMSAARVILPVAGAIFLITQSELVLICHHTIVRLRRARRTRS
jgi:hypothetical protein